MDYKLRSQTPALDPDFLDAVKHQFQTTKQRLKQVREQTEALRLEEDELKRIASSLENLIATAKVALEDPQGKSAAARNSQGSHIAQASIERPTSAQAELAAKILDEQGKEPMHYRTLAEEVQRRGGDLRGQDPTATLNALLSRDERFVRPFRRGYYSLRKHYPNLKRSVGARRRGRNSRM